MRSAEQNLSPCCGDALKVIGSRPRTHIDSAGNKDALIIRRLRCLHCKRIHHELPDILFPYKRYGSESIEAAVSGSSDLCVAADESTIARWRKWFLEMANYLLGCLTSIAFRLGKGSVEEMIRLPKSALQRIGYYVGDAPGWLARVVRPVANANLWVHTRSAFCP